MNNRRFIIINIYIKSAYKKTTDLIKKIFLNEILIKISEE